MKYTSYNYDQVNKYNLSNYSVKNKDKIPKISTILQTIVVIWDEIINIIKKNKIAII